MTCERCDQRATVHYTTIDNGKKSEKHLCVECAQRDNPAIANAGISELLAKFVAKHRPDEAEEN
jgi:protein-arginine kinase activator protein McsA